MKPDRSQGASGPPRAAVPEASFGLRPDAGDRWRASLREVTLRPEPPARRQEVLLDSFDRRLQRAGIHLTLSGRAPHLRCRIAGRLACPGEVELVRAPEFAWDLPHPQALELARTLEARGLERLGTHSLEVARWAVVDGEGKAVARIEEELHRVRGTAAGAGPEPVRRVVLRGVRGYDQEFARAEGLLRDQGLLPLARDTEFDPCGLLDEPQARPGRWPSVGPRTKAFPALARIVRAQLEVFRTCERGMRAGRDAEYLHDARVALRRVRSLMGQLEGILAAEEGEHLARELRWLAGVLGEVRDLDTLLFELRLCEPELRDRLAGVLERLEQEHHRRQARLVRHLDSRRRARLDARLEAVLAADPRGLVGPRGATPFARVLAKRLRRRLTRVFARAERLGAEESLEDLHELRIATKKLRYLVECCRGLVPGHALTLALAELKGLQGALGTIQDARVHAEMIDALAAGIAADSGAPALLALGRFQERVLARGAAARQAFRERRSAFLSSTQRAKLEALLAHLGAERAAR